MPEQSLNADGVIGLDLEPYERFCEQGVDSEAGDLQAGIDAVA